MPRTGLELRNSGFTEGDADDFFGREEVVARLITRLRDGAPQDRFLAVVGPSGSGKSSLVRAGLIPALRAGAIDGSDTWFIASMVPGSRPFDELASALRHVAVDPPADLSGSLSARVSTPSRARSCRRSISFSS